MTENNKEVIEKAQDLIDQPITYKKMIEHLGLPIKSGKGKVAQLRALTRYMKIDKQKSPTRFIIRENL